MGFDFYEHIETCDCQCTGCHDEGTCPRCDPLHPIHEYEPTD